VLLSAIPTCYPSCCRSGGSTNEPTRAMEPAVHLGLRLRQDCGVHVNRTHRMGKRGQTPARLRSGRRSGSRTPGWKSRPEFQALADSRMPTMAALARDVESARGSPRPSSPATSSADGEGLLISALRSGRSACAQPRPSPMKSCAMLTMAGRASQRRRGSSSRGSRVTPSKST